MQYLVQIFNKLKIFNLTNKNLPSYKLSVVTVCCSCDLEIRSRSLQWHAKLNKHYHHATFDMDDVDSVPANPKC